MTPADERTWCKLIELCINRAPVKDIRAFAKGMKQVVMPRSEWTDPKSPFVLLKGVAALMNGTDEARDKVKEFAERCQVILGGPKAGEVEAPAQDGRPSRRYRRDIDD